MQRRRRRRPIAASIIESRQRQQAEHDAARARSAADAACLHSAPPLETRPIDQPVVTDDERDAAFTGRRHND